MKDTIQPHSKLGIASCVIGLITFLIFLIAMVFFLNHFWCEGCFRELMMHLSLWSIVYMLCVPIPAHIVGFILGAISLFFPNRKKLFPILGIVLNLIFGLVGAFPLLLGVALAA